MTVKMVQDVRCPDCGFETTIAIGFPAYASHNGCKPEFWLPRGQARYIEGSRGPVRAEVFDGIRQRKPCPGCAEPCNQCDQEALD